MSNLFRKPASTESKTNKYERLGFKHNPFPIDPAVKPDSRDERENGSIYISDLRSEEIKQFQDIVLASDSKINLLMDYAAYRGRGIGKTAFLNYLKKEINKDLGGALTGNQQVLYAAYFAPGGEKKERRFSQLARLIFDAICNQDLLLITFCRLRALTGIISDDILSEIDPLKIAETIGNDSWLSERGVDISELDSRVSGLLRENGVNFYSPSQGLFLFEDDFVNFKKIFSVENTEIYWKKYGVDFVFNDMVRFFKAAQFSNILLFFDEAEKIIIAQNFSERREFLDNLRYYFIDGRSESASSSFFKLLMTIHPNSQELLLSHWHAAGLDRFSELGGEGANANTVFFKPLKDKNSAVVLAREYINKAKISEINDNNISPFDEDSLETAINISDGIPGRFLKLLYNSIEQAVSEGWDKITKENIQNIWKKVVEVEFKPKINPEELSATKTNLQG